MLANHGSQQLGRERESYERRRRRAPLPCLARSPLRNSEAPSSCSEATGGLGSILKRARRCADARDDVSALMSASRNGELSGGGGGGSSSGGGSDGKSPAAQPDSPKTAPAAGHARGRESRSRLAGVALQRLPLLRLLLQPPETPSPPPPAWDGTEHAKGGKGKARAPGPSDPREWRRNRPEGGVGRISSPPSRPPAA